MITVGLQVEIMLYAYSTLFGLGSNTYALIVIQVARRTAIVARGVDFDLSLHCTTGMVLLLKRCPSSTPYPETLLTIRPFGDAFQQWSSARMGRINVLYILLVSQVSVLP